MKTLSVISLLILALFISGCSQKEFVASKTEFITKEPLNLTPKPVDLEEVTFKVIILDQSYFALDSKNYEKMSINVQKLENYIKEQNIILKKYKEYYEKP